MIYKNKSKRIWIRYLFEKYNWNERLINIHNLYSYDSNKLFFVERFNVIIKNILLL